MALATFSGASWASGAVFVNAQYDTGTLLLQSIDYQNLTSQPGQMTVFGPSNFSRVFAIPANTIETSTDLSSLNAHMVQITATSPKSGQQQTYISLPTGWSASFNWPV